MSSSIRYVTEPDLRATIDDILTRYPWFADYLVNCHATCARWEIAEEHGHAAGDAWHDYDAALWMLTGKNAGRTTDE